MIEGGVWLGAAGGNVRNHPRRDPIMKLSPAAERIAKAPRARVQVSYEDRVFCKGEAGPFENGSSSDWAG
jgi:hypothetical protein